MNTVTPIDSHYSAVLPRAWSHRDALAVFLVLLAIYLLTLSGHLYSPDEEAMYYVTRGIATGSGVAVPTDDVVPMPLREGLHDASYAPYGVLPSLLALPFYGLGALGALGAPAQIYDYTTRFAVSALNAPITALTAALLLSFAARLGGKRRTAWLVALGYGLCTFAWPYARTFFSEPLTALLLLAAVERAYVYHTTGDRRALLLSGFAAGLLLPTRIVEVIALPLLALYVFLSTNDQRPTTKHERLDPWLGVVGRRWSFVVDRSSLVALVIWLSAMLPGVLVLIGYNLARFGTPLATGYGGEGNAFTTPLSEGLYGLLLSPGKSLFLYAPPALLGVVGLSRLWRRERKVTLLLVALIVAHILVYALWHAWDGGGVWGPRLLLPIVPLLMLAIVGGDEAGNGRRDTTRRRGDETGGGGQDTGGDKATRRRGDETGGGKREAKGRMWLVVGSRSLIALLLALGFINALAGVLVHFGVYINSGVPARYRHYIVAQSPLIAHWRILAERVGARYGAEQCAIADGFYSTEAKDQLLPRYTGARATIKCRASGSSIVHLSINDYRPPDAAPSELALTTGNQRAALRPTQGSQVYVLLPVGGGELTLTNTTWNPAAAGVDKRDGLVGTLLYGFTVAEQAGNEVSLVDAAVEPAPASPRLMWGWYFVPYDHHLVDFWWWYAPRVGLSLGGVIALGVAVIGTACAALAGAWWTLRSKKGNKT